MAGKNKGKTGLEYPSIGKISDSSPNSLIENTIYECLKRHNLRLGDWLFPTSENYLADYIHFHGFKAYKKGLIFRFTWRRWFVWTIYIP